MTPKRRPRRKAIRAKRAPHITRTRRTGKKRERLPSTVHRLLSAVPNPGTPPEQFVRLSVELTGFDEAELHGTGMMQTYYALIPSIIGQDLFGRLLSRWANIYVRGVGDERLLEQLVTTELL